MIQEGYLEANNKENVRDTTAKMLESDADWHTHYIKEEALDTLEYKNREALEGG